MAIHYEPLTENGRPRGSRAALLANILLFCTSLLMLLLSYTNAGGLVCTNEKAWRVLNVPSPILDHLELPTSTQQLKGELGDPYDIWSQPPSPEIDRAWNELNDDNLAYVTSKDILAAGKNLSVAVKFPSDAGFGDDAYPILVDVKHKIHCLNRIRKDLYFDHYWASAYPDGETTDLHKDHTNHCVSILLKSLMCEASTDFITYAWYDGYDHPHPDFNIERKCGDFTGVNDWTAARSLDGDEFFNLPKPAGQVTLSMTDEALRALGQQDG